MVLNVKAVEIRSFVIGAGALSIVAGLVGLTTNLVLVVGFGLALLVMSFFLD